MTDWEEQLQQKADALARAKVELDECIAAARLDGKTFREIGRCARINHESARTIAARINGNSRTRTDSRTRTEQTATP
ncbi:hypothetical protein OS965_02420 [Streptomyces sp. H27-G5]|uniref:hypothetical protein n=1 Tax=Streptomyces sp. H27-G5 TaxID=2996698 RepID=UPI002271F12A|nr:hypothetical protein [Streptomyces sp. H27-G5]MCY0917031.1 hypothetical protein [Streptomyces sp. H27-G5]